MPIRLATPRDVCEIVSLWMRMMHEHQQFEPRLQLAAAADAAYESYVRLHLRSPRSLVGVFEEDGEPLGFILAYVSANMPTFLPSEFGFISDIYLLPSARGSGRGRALVAWATDWFRGQGVKQAHLQVYEGNASGRAFWKTAGFEPYVQRLVLDLEGGKGDDA